MSIATSLLYEFEAQAAVTRRFLERLPEERLMWRPHERSMTAGQLALHLATVPGRVVHAIEKDEQQVPDFGEFAQPTSCDEVMRALEASVATVKELLPRFSDAAMNAPWRLLAGEKEVLRQPRQQFLRDVMLSHCYQHRGQFSVYLRLMNLPVPASWGPSADEPPLFVQAEALARPREAVAV